MTDPSPRDAAGAGPVLVATTVLCAGPGLAAAAHAGAPVPFPPAGAFAGLFAGAGLVHARSEDL